MADDYDFLFKSVVVGDGGSGKTAVVVRFSQGFFQENYKLTIGVEFAVKTINISNYNVKLQIWDTGGQERFRYVRPLYYKGSMGCIILFDLTNRESFDHVPKWLEEVKKESGDIPILLVGNKSDLINERAVSLKEANQIAKDLNMFYVESSAKNGKGVGDVFAILSLLMIGEDIPPEMLKTNIPGESVIKKSISKTASIENKQEEKPILSLKPSPISTSVVKPSPIPKSINDLGFNSQDSKSKEEPEWFAPAVSPKPKAYIFKSKPEPKPYIPETKPEPKPFIPKEILKKPENQNLFLSNISKELAPKSDESDFFAPSIPKKSSLNQIKKNSVQSVSSNPFLTQNRELILPKKSSNLPNDINNINTNNSNNEDNSSILLDALKETSGKIPSKKPIWKQPVSKQSTSKSSWGFMSNINKPSTSTSSESQNKNNLSFKSSDQNLKPQHEKLLDKMKLKCPRCGSLVNKNFKFCNKCGNRI